MSAPDTFAASCNFGCIDVIFHYPDGDGTPSLGLDTVAGIIGFAGFAHAELDAGPMVLCNLQSKDDQALASFSLAAARTLRAKLDAAIAAAEALA